LKTPGAGGKKTVESFRALCCLGRYREAFEAAEDLLRRKEIGLVDLWSPWFSNRHTPVSFWKKHISILSETAVPDKFLIWKEFYLAALRPLSRGMRATSAFCDISADFSGRYAWMRFFKAFEMLSRGDVRAALAEFRTVSSLLEHDPMFRCKYGEALLCAGKRAACFREFDAAISMPDWRNESTAWKGEMYLMAGEYGLAVEMLAGVRATFSSGWLGAAYYKTGRPSEARELLEAAVQKNDPFDHEVKLWLAELYRSEGAYPRSRRLLDQLLEKEPGYDFARINRALLFMALGRPSLMRRDMARVDQRLIRAAAEDIGLKTEKELSVEEAVRILNRVLNMAGGNRRVEKYFLAINFPNWFRPAGPGAARGKG